MELDTIYNMDCLEGMRQIPDGSIDAVICDLPYGTVKGMAIEGWKNKGDTCQWDEQLPTEELMEQYTRILRQNGVAILFSQEPYTHELRAYGDSGFRFVYPLIWIKNNFANAFSSDTAPVSYFEDMSVFRKIYDMSNQNPLRDYSLKVLQYIGRPRREIINDIGQCVDHFFRHSSSQFAIPTPETYQALVDKYGIDKMEGFKTYDQLEQSGITGKLTFKVPNNSNHITVDHKEYEAVRKLQDKKIAIVKQSEEFEQQVYDALVALRTEKNVEKELPEAMKYLVFPEVKAVPMPVFTGLRDIIGKIKED